MIYYVRAARPARLRPSRVRVRTTRGRPAEFNNLVRIYIYRSPAENNCAHEIDSFEIRMF